MTQKQHSSPGLSGTILERSGLVLVDKPEGMTSHDVVAKLRRILGTKKVGHSGTLDPMATGVLVLGVERGTKFLAHVVAHDKRYEATVRLGATTLTDDREGEVLSTADASALTALANDVERIREAFEEQRGKIMQRPTQVSSIKIDGRRAHELVREGKEFEIPARPVEVFALDITRIESAPESGEIDVDISVHCSSGTYIRAIARDVGAWLGVGGHLVALRRTSVGPFDAEHLVTLEELSGAPRLSLSLDEAMCQCFPTRDITEAEAKNLSLGKWLAPQGRREVYAAVTAEGRAIALLQESGKRAWSVFVARPDGMS